MIVKSLRLVSVSLCCIQVYYAKGNVNNHPVIEFAKKHKTRNNTGFYYGIRDDIFFPRDFHSSKASKTMRKVKGNRCLRSCLGQSLNSLKLALSKPRTFRGVHQMAATTALEDILGETLLELREMREDIALLREEMQSMKDEITRSKIMREEASATLDRTDDGFQQSQYGDPPTSSFEYNTEKKKFYDLVGLEVAKWAQSLLVEQEGEHSDWKEVKCNSMMAKKFNKHGQTRCYIKVRSDIIYKNNSYAKIKKSFHFFRL